ncbi:hypothetical protein RugamoR64_39780 [Duganella rhizosphaerae]|uniref:hypothetical protein n=1 Tax=Duganella rhizosphaerae TaxID=2885763 RepID=UPI0030E9C376
MARKTMMLVITFLIVVRGVFAATPDYVQIGQASVSGYRCATLAAHARYVDEEKRLMVFALSNARVFIQAARGKKVSMEEFNRSEFVLPVVLRAWNFADLDVPVDFAAGQVYESIWEQTTAELGEKSSAMTTYQVDYRVWGRAKFKEQNCELLGK